MKWDLWNPWALWYEVHSTHPLPAKRIRALELQSSRMGQEPAFDFPEQQPEGYWDEFAVDFLTNLLPTLGVLTGLAAGIGLAMAGKSGWLMAGLCLLGLGLGCLLKLFRSHPAGAFPERAVESLVGEVKVSAIRSIPCMVTGAIIGRGIPGLFWSKDLVLQDETGFITLIYEQPLGFLNTLFGIFRAEQCVGQRARAVGWYRRAPRPYFELLRVEFDGMPTQNCHLYKTSLILSWLALIAGVALAFFGMA